MESIKSIRQKGKHAQSSSQSNHGPHRKVCGTYKEVACTVMWYSHGEQAAGSA